MVAHSNATAPLEENRQQVLLELIDMSSTAERAGLDLVAVLDVSGSMLRDGKLDKLKTAMKFVISKLGPMDRLSIVSFSDDAKRLCPLRCMTEASKEYMTMEIVEKKLEAYSTTNMRDGLETGLRVLATRRHGSSGRVASIIFMSDGHQNEGGDAAAVQIRDRDVAVYTFGFGADQDAKVLEAIAGNSHGGTYYDVKDGEYLSVHFSALLAGVLSVVVRDLELTVWEEPRHSEIEAVDAGSYPKEPPGNRRGSPVTVRFGDLYSGEERRVMVDLLLPAVSRDYSATVLNARCTYSTQVRHFSGDLRWVIRRSRSAVAGAVNPEVKVEQVRRDHTERIEAASKARDPSSAKAKLLEAKEALDDVDKSHKLKHGMLDKLKAELAKLLELATRTWEELLAALLASKLSHQRQRFASRGDVELDIFEPSRKRRYVQQATKFEEHPSSPPPSVEDDIRKEEAEAAAAAVDQPRPLHPEEPRPNPRVWPPDHRRTSGWWAWAAVLLCTALAVAVILAGAAVFAVYLLYRPRTPYLAVSDARLEQLQYGQDGAIDYLRMSITVLAVNNNSKADASFPAVDLAVGFNGADVALLQAQPFVVARESSLPLRYDVVSAGRALDAAGMQAMDEALKAGVVPFDLSGKARTRWKVGVFARIQFWTRLSCRLRFFFPGNGTVMPADRDKCRSRSP
ncbi:hypothetical protein U9M48_001894 [Paspalum notatum var. saurae]|uniref:VWFA domain-containing protein n=1 Tax=Paspalum notatum var. saurae TaxID=547442 RepID=A0AAQ3PPQ1_PASNO